MTINQNIAVLDIQSSFREEYPHLDIRFYHKSHDEYEGSEVVYEVLGNELLIRLNPNLQDGEIDISSYVTVGQVETAFEEAFGLHVQIFRKSGDTWLQTSKTDNWTLKHQEEKALEMEGFNSGI